VRRLIGWAAGLVGIAALARMLARRQARHEAASRRPPPAPGADPAEELRRRLSATRQSDPTATGEEPSAAAAKPTETIDERRARVHAKAQEAIEAMQGPAE
jgi:hypothetical protein